MKAKKEKIDEYTPDALGVDVTPMISTVEVFEAPKRAPGVMVESVKELVDKLHNEAKVI